MVGDTSFDMAMAVSAGAAPIGVAWGYHPKGALFGAGAVTVVETTAALGDLFSGPLAQPETVPLAEDLRRG
jgi:phosphoglycolate phosphatase